MKQHEGILMIAFGLFLTFCFILPSAAPSNAMEQGRSERQTQVGLVASAVLVAIGVVKFLRRGRHIPRVLYPASHADAVAMVYRVVDLIKTNPEVSDDDLVAALTREGVGTVDAELVVRYVPMAFTYAWLRSFGMEKFPGLCFVCDASGNLVELPFQFEHYFLAALGVGEEAIHRRSERITQETLMIVTSRSAEMDAVCTAIEGGRAIKEIVASFHCLSLLSGLTSEQIAASRWKPA